MTAGPNPYGYPHWKQKIRKGRPRGSGARTVRIAPRTDQAGMLIFIGRALWQEMNYPPRVSFYFPPDDPDRWWIMPGDDYKVIAHGQSIPRLVMGRERAAEYGFNIGTYPASVVHPKKCVPYHIVVYD